MGLAIGVAKGPRGKEGQACGKGGRGSSAPAILHVHLTARLELLGDKCCACLILINTGTRTGPCPRSGAPPGVWQLRAPSLPCFQAPSFSCPE